MVATIYDEECNPLGSLTAVHNTYTQGGIAFRYWYLDASGMGSFDTVEIGAVSATESTTWGDVKGLFH